MSQWGVAEAREIDDLLASVDAALARIAAVPLVRLGDDDVLGVTRRLERSARRMLVPQIALAGQIRDRNIADGKGCPSAAALLSQMLTISKLDASTRVRAAQLTLPTETLSGEELPAVLPATADALGRGELGSDQLRVITGTMAKIPAAVDDETRALCERTLVDEALHRPAAGLEAVAAHLRRLSIRTGRLRMRISPTRWSSPSARNARTG